MKATLMEFTGYQVMRQTGQRPIEIIGDAVVRQPPRDPRYNRLVAGLFCTFRLESGDEVPCTVRVTKVRRTRPGDVIVELGPVEGLPPGALYDREDFAEKARAFYKDEVVPLVLGGGK